MINDFKNFLQNNLSDQNIQYILLGITHDEAEPQGLNVLHDVEDQLIGWAQPRKICLFFEGFPYDNGKLYNNDDFTTINKIASEKRELLRDLQSRGIEIYGCETEKSDPFVSIALDYPLTCEKLKTCAKEKHLWDSVNDEYLLCLKKETKNETDIVTNLESALKVKVCVGEDGLGRIRNANDEWAKILKEHSNKNTVCILTCGSKHLPLATAKIIKDEKENIITEKGLQARLGKSCVSRHLAYHDSKLSKKYIPEAEKEFLPKTKELCFIEYLPIDYVSVGQKPQVENQALSTFEIVDEEETQENQRNRCSFCFNSCAIL